VRVKMIRKKTLRAIEPVAVGIAAGTLMGYTVSSDAYLLFAVQSMPFWAQILFAFAPIVIYGLVDTLAYRKYARVIARVGIFCTAYATTTIWVTTVPFGFIRMLEMVTHPLRVLSEFFIVLGISLVGIPIAVVLTLIVKIVLGEHTIADRYHCNSCAYDRRGIDADAPCPECGLTQTEALQPRGRLRKPIWRVFLVLVAVMCVWNTIGLAQNIRGIAIPAYRFVRSLPEKNESLVGFNYSSARFEEIGWYSAIAYAISPSAFPEDMDPRIISLTATYISSVEPDAPRIQFKVEMPNVKGPSAGSMPQRFHLIYWHLDAEGAARFFASGGLTEERIRELARRTAAEAPSADPANPDVGYLDLDW